MKELIEKTNRKTIKDVIKISGIGLHTGKTIELILEPTENFSGINFFINNEKISANVDNVIDTQRCTVLGKNGEKIFTVEHLLSALYGLRITDLNIYVSNSEIPCFDGSAKVFVENIIEVGIIENQVDNSILKLDVEDTVNFNSSRYEIYPEKKFILSCGISYPNTIVGEQKFELVLTPESYIKEIANAKTFCFLKDVEKIKSSGMGQGGSLENVIVVGEKEILNPEKMFYRNEFVRHKILDFIGDLSLIGRQVIGKINFFSSSHYSNIEFVKWLKTKYHT